MFVEAVKSTGKCVFIFVFLLIIWILNVKLSHHRAMQETAPNQAMLMSQIQQANHAVLRQREKLTTLYDKYLQHRAIGSYQLNWFRQQFLNQVIYFNPYSEHDWQEIINKIDVVPTALVLHEAAQQSHYGTTELAQHANNFFNIVLARAESGYSDSSITKWQRAYNWLEPNDLQYARYIGAQAAIADYVWILNTAPQYHKFREYRLLLRRKHQAVLTANSPYLESVVQAKIHASASLYGNNMTPVFPHVY